MDIVPFLFVASSRNGDPISGPPFLFFLQMHTHDPPTLSFHGAMASFPLPAWIITQGHLSGGALVIHSLLSWHFSRPYA